MWLAGLAGTGKSSLMATLSNNFSTDEKCHVVFIRFDRNEYKGASSFTTTLAYKLAQLDDRFGAVIAGAVEKTPGIIQHTELLTQFEVLIRVPLRKFAGKNDEKPVVVLLDGLDECKERDQLLDILTNRSLKDLPFLRIIVTSRPEEDIVSAFEGCPQISSFKLDTSSHETTADIKLFIGHHLQVIGRKLPEFSALCEETDAVWELSYRASGLFIWASTITAFIAAFPMSRLPLVLNTGVPTSALDALTTLYKTALNSIADETGGSDIQSSIHSVLGAIMVASNCEVPGHPITFQSASILESVTNVSHVYQLLRRMGSIVSVGKYYDPRLLHKSLDDFLLDKARCGEGWYIHLPDHHHDIATACVAGACVWLKSLDAEGEEPWHSKNLSGAEARSKFTTNYLFQFLQTINFENISSVSPLPKLLKQFFQLYWLRFLAYRPQIYQERFRLAMRGITFSKVTMSITLHPL
jgi:hypothetical protein